MGHGTYRMHGGTGDQVSGIRCRLSGIGCRGIPWDMDIASLHRDSSVPFPVPISDIEQWISIILCNKMYPPP